MAFSRASTLPLSGSAALAAAPLDSAETGIAKQGVNKADGSHRLASVGPVGMARIPEGRDVLEPEGMTTINAQSESQIQAADVFSSFRVSATVPVK